MKRTMSRIAALGLSLCAAISTGTAADAPLVLVAGGTGRTGEEVVKQLLAENYRVRVLVRDEARAREQFGDAVEYVTGDVREAETLEGVARGATYVISALGSNVRKDPTNLPERVDYGGVRNLVEQASGAGVSQFVLVSSMGVTQPDHMLNRMFNNILQWKLKGEDHLRASGVPYTIVRPGGLTTEPGGRQGIKAEQGDRPGDGQSAPGMIARADVATVVVRALGNRDAVGKTLEIVSDPATTRVEWDSFFKDLVTDPAK
ncbi:MAG: SDR family oxidoreductase [Gammaproteobacteria bacterium]|nr:SDR family oxidoreductase [Gammaproteobacteria bacterium]